ncbi:MAG: thiamine pyrophosphate-dependent dehydrogenase E1 component subunit alpha [Candidatus Bathyarchaeia archaeon]
MKISDEKLVDMYRKMLLIRFFEEKTVELFAAGKIPGFVHLYIGEEAIAVGACSAISAEDVITSTHRGHGHLIAKDGDVKYMFAELLGKKTGYCKGKGGSMHIADVKLGILGANGIVGAGIPLATGAAASIKYRKTNQVAVCFFGDGASNQGSFHESLNLASIWKLPIVYVCENNGYAISAPVSYHVNVKDISVRSTAYGVPGITIDGNDVLAVYNAATEAVDRAKKGGGPTLIECRTYRWRGHFEGDTQVYRTQEEIERWKALCPITRFESYLLKQSVITEADASQIRGEVSMEIEGAIKYADSSPSPSPEEALEDLFAA